MFPVLYALLQLVREFWWFLLGPVAQLDGPGSTMDTSCLQRVSGITIVLHLNALTKTKIQYHTARQIPMLLYSIMWKPTALALHALHTTIIKNWIALCAPNKLDITEWCVCTCRSWFLINLIMTLFCIVELCIMIELVLNANIAGIVCYME